MTFNQSQDMVKLALCLSVTSSIAVQIDSYWNSKSLTLRKVANPYLFPVKSF